MLLFLSYLVGVICLTHVNIIDGELVVHAHLRSLEERQHPIDFHKSQSDELLQLQQFYNITSDGVLAVVDTPPRLDFYLFDIELGEVPFLLSAYAHEMHRRGPPSADLL